MKANILSACRRNLRSAVAIAALLVLGGLTAVGQQRFDPLGTTWDCLIGGSGQQGIAFLTFSNDYTFTGYQLLVGKQSAASSGGGRNSGGDTGRGTSGDTNAPAGGGTNLFGFQDDVNGRWDYDQKGRVMGYFLEILNQQTSITTNETYTTVTETTTNAITNPDGTISYIVTNIVLTTTNTAYVTNTTGTTNGISFTAKVVPLKRLSLVSSTPYGKVTYKGVPQDQKPIPAALISGSWYGIKKENKQDVLEFFNLLDFGVKNIYVTTNGQEPGLSFYGYSMVSVQKKIGFAFATFPGVVTNFAGATGGAVSATFGSINYPTKGTKANTTGWEEPMARVTFQAQRKGP